MNKREIKFRAWRPDLGRHIYQIEVLSLVEKTGGEIQQYTGLEDLDGGDIYDGDIIQFKFRNKRGDVSTFLGKVFWDQYMWLVETADGDQYSLNRIYNPRIFGNIHEHLHLLNPE